MRFFLLGYNKIDKKQNFGAHNIAESGVSIHRY